MTIATTNQKPNPTGRSKTVRPGIDAPMTYEDYMAGPEEMRRYDIIEGYQAYRLYGAEQLPNPTRDHNNIIVNLMLTLRCFERSAQIAEVIIAPCDILITRSPFHIRQPDVSLISKERLARNPPPDNPAPLDPAPELVIEIMSPFDHPSMLAAKICDYRAVAVREIWVVRPVDRSIEVVGLSLDEVKTAGIYGAGGSVISVFFPDLTVAVDDVFRE